MRQGLYLFVKVDFVIIIRCRFVKNCFYRKEGSYFWNSAFDKEFGGGFLFVKFIS